MSLNTVHTMNYWHACESMLSQNNTVSVGFPLDPFHFISALIVQDYLTVPTVKTFFQNQNESTFSPKSYPM